MNDLVCILALRMIYDLLIVSLSIRNMEKQSFCLHFEKDLCGDKHKQTPERPEHENLMNVVTPQKTNKYDGRVSIEDNSSVFSLLVIFAFTAWTQGVNARYNGIKSNRYPMPVVDEICRSLLIFYRRV